MTIPERLRDEVLHIIALGRGRHGWHAIATRLSSKVVPRAPGLDDVLRQLHEGGLAEAVDDGDGSTRWRLTAEGSTALSERRTPPSSATFAHAARRVADLLYSESEVLDDVVLVPEVEPTPDESAWLAILVDDARLALESGVRAQSSFTAEDRARLKGATDRAHATADWRTFMESLRGIVSLPPSVDLYFRGRAWHRLGFHSLAAAVYHRAQRLDPHDHRIGGQRLSALADAEEWDRLGLAIEEIRQDPSAHLELALMAEVAAYRAMLGEREAVPSSRYEDSAHRLSELLAEPTSGGILPSIVASGAIAAALCFDKIGGQAQARRFAAHATRLMPDSGPAWLVRGLIGHRHGSRTAREHLSVAARFMPSFVWPRVYLAHLAVLDGSYDECLRWCEEGLPLDATDVVRAALHEWRGISRAATGVPHHEARADLRAAIALDPDESSYRTNLVAFDHAAEPSRYELQVSEAFRAQATRAVSFAPLSELAA